MLEEAALVDRRRREPQEPSGAYGVTEVQAEVQAEGVLREWSGGRPMERPRGRSSWCSAHASWTCGPRRACTAVATPQFNTLGPRHVVSSANGDSMVGGGGGGGGGAAPSGRLWALARTLHASAVGCGLAQRLLHPGKQRRVLRPPRLFGLPRALRVRRLPPGEQRCGLVRGLAPAPRLLRDHGQPRSLRSLRNSHRAQASLFPSYITLCAPAYFRGHS